MKKFSYLCPNHIAQLQISEKRAMSYWVEIMRRGVKAYSQCRVEASELYLSAAIEIYLLRSACNENSFFSGCHLLKPLDFVLELFIQNQAFDKASKLLGKIESFVEQNNVELSAAILDHIESGYQRIESEEKQYLYQCFGGGDKLLANKNIQYPSSRFH